MGDFIEKILLIKIRKANENDANDWAQILRQSADAIYSQYLSREYMDKTYSESRQKEIFLKDMNKSDVELYMLIFNSIPVGILKIGKPVKYYSDGNNYYRDNIDGIGEVKSLHIKSEYHGYGIGSQAIAFAENRLKELNYNKSSIWVKMHNINAIKFYTSRGYEKINFINLNTKDKLPSMVMEKTLKIQTKEEEDKTY